MEEPLDGGMVIDELYLHYNLIVSDDEDSVFTNCDRCGHVVAEFDYDTIADCDEMDLYEMIIDRHAPIGE